MSSDEVWERACAYAERNQLSLEDQLGFGIHGSVWTVQSHLQNGQAAIKVFYRQATAFEQSPYQRERDVYLWLREQAVRSIRSCQVPKLLHHDDELLVIQMAIVTPPFILDFAAAYLDEPPEFSNEVWSDWQKEKEELFGTRWPEVQDILRELRLLGIHQTDVSMGNIMLSEI